MFDVVILLPMQMNTNQIKSSNHLFESGDMAHTQALTHTHTMHNNTKEGK